MRFTALYMARKHNASTETHEDTPMTLTTIRAAALLAACLATAAAFGQSAPMPPGARQMDGPDARPEHSRRGPGLPFLRGIDLSEAQQDRLFAIMHEGAPKHREHDKARRKASEALRAASNEGKFDEARASAAAQALGQAIAAEELLRARTEAQVLGLLTPQQRAARVNRSGE
jgi:Spy/CpxP family protein refolding chaperone